MTERDDLVAIVGEAIVVVFGAVVRDGWRGREREAVSLFAFEFLVPHAGGAALETASQIGIECAVPQVTDDGKRQVCKDLVIWPQPRMTVWDQQRRPTQVPRMILEWKVAGHPTTSKRTIEELLRADIAWLEKFTSRYPDTLGVAVGIRWGQPSLLRARRVMGGRAEVRWWLSSEDAGPTPGEAPCRSVIPPN